MPCEHIRLPNGATAVVCYSKKRARRCACGQSAAYECDWCDKPVCNSCGAHAKNGVDACPAHVYELREREAIQSA